MKCEEIDTLIFYDTPFPIKAFTTTKDFLNIKSLKIAYNSEILRELQEPKRSILLHLIRHIKLPSFSKILLCEQVHGNKVIFVDTSYTFKDLIIDENKYFYVFFRNVDGLVTDLKNSIIFIFTADCIPFLVYEPKNCIIGLLHIGRRSLESDIVGNFLKVINPKVSDISTFKFIIGPHICKDCYLVNGVRYDLSFRLKSKLLKAKIKPFQIYTAPYCTSCQNDKFFSFRKEHTSFRVVSAISNL